FISFCIEINENISPGPQSGMTLAQIKDAPVYGAGPPESPMKDVGAQNLAKLWANYLDDAVGINGLAHNANMIGAFQLAVWEISYDHGTQAGLGSLNPLSLTGGNFKVQSN